MPGIQTRILTVAILLMSSFYATAQEEPARTVASRPDVPGHFLIDFGLNQGLNQPPKGFKRGFWGSRAINLSYYYPFRFGASKFSFIPGIGISMERFKWANNYVLKDTTDNEEVYDLVPNTYYPGLRKSQLITNYLEIPLEFRFDANPSDPSRTFWVSLGGRIGVMASSQTKVKYKEAGEIHKIKDRDQFGLNQIRYAATLRWGVGGFGWFVNYNLTPMFEKAKGPQKADLSVLTAGITINGL